METYSMNTEQIKKQINNLKAMLEDMKQERVEALNVYPESHWFVRDIDEDILLCSLSINDLRITLQTKGAK